MEPFRRTLVNLYSSGNISNGGESGPPSTALGAALNLTCQPPRRYPDGKIYWAVTASRSNNPFAIENDDRILLDYDGSITSFSFIYSFLFYLFISFDNYCTISLQKYQ